ncbi:H-type lectin domain-containing protein [Streptomyces fradiae]|uniref:H-type lectin domain-containing protein n=1 Tax=Streptomyces fradiae TaxID=1906 RepID=UPI00340E26B5
MRAAWLQPTGQTREDTRAAPLGTMTPTGALTTRSGVIPGGDPLAATGTAAMSVQVGTGRAIVQGTATQGAYPVAVTAPETAVLADGHAQFVRVDSVILRVYDGLFDTDGQTLAAIEVVQGEATATPTAPSIPPAALRLWDVTVPAGASAGTGGIPWATALTDRRVYTTAVGGITPGAADGTYAGQWRDNAGILERYTGTAWEAAVRLGTSGQVVFGDARLYRSAGALRTDSHLVVKGGHRVLTGEAATENVTFTSTDSHVRDIAFTTPFSTTPVVTLSLSAATEPTAGWHVRPYQITTTGFRLWCYRPGNPGAWSGIPVGWTATEPTK